MNYSAWYFHGVILRYQEVEMNRRLIYCIFSIAVLAAALMRPISSMAGDGKKSGWENEKESISFNLSAGAKSNQYQLIEDSRKVLGELGVSKDDYSILYIPEANRVIIKAAGKRTRELVLKTIKDVEANNLTVRTEVIPLQYANASNVCAMLENIYSKKIYIQKDDDKITVKKDDGNIDISKDIRTNSILVTAPQNLIGGMREMIKKLDCKTDQIHIKVLIAEVTLDGSMQYGVEWKFSDANFFGNENSRQTGTVDYGHQAQSKKDELLGFKYSLMSGSKLNAFIQMLRTQSHIDVLASPELLTSNNMKAQFQETIKVPVQKTTSTANGVISTSTEYQNVGIDLTVLPQVNIDGYVNLEIAQTIQNILETLSNNKQNAPTYSNRVINTNVLVKNGSTVVIGGLFKNNESAAGNKVPGLSGIPFLGKLFGRSVKGNIKTELMVFLTPEITRTDNDFDKTVDELKAPEIKERLKAAKASKTAGFGQSDKPRITVVSVSDEKVVITAGANQKLKKGEELIIVRPEKEYYHPETHQLVSVEEKEIARIKVEVIKEKTSVAAIINMGSNETILAGDLVLPEESQVVFENFKISSMKIELNPASDYGSTGLKMTARIKNTTKNPLLKTKLVEKLTDKTDPKISKKVVTFNHERSRVYLVENGVEHPLKLTQKLESDNLLETAILFNRIIKPEEEIDIRTETVLKFGISELEGVRAQFVSDGNYSRINSSNGPKDPKTSIGLSINFPDRIIIKDFNYQPAVIDNAMDGTTLIWTQEGAPLNIKGFWRFEDAAAVKTRIGPKMAERKAN